ncbi:MAG: hypothetical protein M0R17_05315 [Candidatus Omnitrophica bacterium]|nr:hypothetical protein [Candidatus Omnitrophota bacterium]
MIHLRDPYINDFPTQSPSSSDSSSSSSSESFSISDSASISMSASPSISNERNYEHTPKRSILSRISKRLVSIISFTK